jgi:uncharacterized protein (TIGR00661 family)
LKKIIYYITDHGKGHATRSIAIIRKLEELGIKVIIRNSNAINFLKKAVPNTRIISGITDVGPVIKKNGISIDQKKSIKKIEKWITNIDKFVEDEIKIISPLNPDLIITDISILPILTAKKMKKRSIAISNFTWYDVMKFLPKKQLEFIKKAYSFADYVIKLPIGTKMDNFDNIQNTGIVSRIPTMSKKDLRKKLKIKESEFIVTFALGGSDENINCKIGKNVKVLSMNSIINSSLNSLNVSDWIEGQDIVNLSDLLICKCGYGLISECITSGTPFFYVVDKNHLEQRAISIELDQKKLGRKIVLKDINQLSIDKEFIKSIPKTIKQPNELNNIVKYIVNKF